jgi:hypothetical protein
MSHHRNAVSATLWSVCPPWAPPPPAKLAGFRHIPLAAHHINTAHVPCTRPSRARMKKPPGRRIRDVPGTSLRQRRRRTVAREARREDCTRVAWYRCVYAPRAGRAYDSHHRTAGVRQDARFSGRHPFETELPLPTPCYSVLCRPGSSRRASHLSVEMRVPSENPGRHLLMISSRNWTRTWGAFGHEQMANRYGTLA